MNILLHQKVFFALLLAWALLVPSFALAHDAGDPELYATIEAAIRSDPRAAQMSEDEVHMMVDALSEEAEAQGVTSAEILWRPQESPEYAARCGSLPDFFCALNEALGFNGSDLKIPIGLGISSALLLFLIGMILHYHGHHPVAGAIRGRDI